MIWLGRFFAAALPLRYEKCLGILKACAQKACGSLCYIGGAFSTSITQYFAQIRSAGAAKPIPPSLHISIPCRINFTPCKTPHFEFKIYIQNKILSRYDRAATRANNMKFIRAAASEHNRLFGRLRVLVSRCGILFADTQGGVNERSPPAVKFQPKRRGEIPT